MPLYRWEIIRRKKPLIGPQIHDVSQVLYLPFDLDDGPYARDRSGYSNHGTIYGPTRVAGKIGGALDFDGVDDFVAVAADPSFNLRTEFTVMAWAKMNVVRPTDYMRIVMHGDQYNLCYDVDYDNWAIIVKDEVGYFRAGWSYANFLAGVWYFFAATFKDGTLSYYVNADLKDTTTGIGTLIDLPALDLWVSTDEVAPARHFDGIIDEVRVYNRALSQSEIKRLMNLRGV